VKKRIFAKRLIWLSLITLVIISLLYWVFSRETLPPKIVIASAGQGGQYYRFAKMIKEPLEKRLGISVEVLTTNGSVENKELIVSGKAQIAILQFGAVSNDKFYSIAPLYYDIAHIIAKKNSNIKGYEDFKNKRILLGPVGSGYRETSLDILKFRGIKYTEVPVKDVDEFYHLLEKNDEGIDLAIITTGLLNPTLKKILASDKYDLIPFNYADAFSIQSSFYQSLKIPKGLYGNNQMIPQEDLRTIGTVAFLAVGENTSNKLVEGVLKSIYETDLKWKFPGLIGKKKAGQWPLLPIHPAAKKYFNPYEGIGVLANFMESINALKELVFAFILGSYLLFKFFKKLGDEEKENLLSIQKEKLDELLIKTISVEEKITNSLGQKELNDFLKEIAKIKIKGLRELADEDLRGDQQFAIFLAQCDNLTNTLHFLLEKRNA